MAINPFKTALERYQQRTGIASSEELSLASELKSATMDPSGDFDDPRDIASKMSELERNRRTGAQKSFISRLTTLGSQSEMKTRINQQAASSTTYMASMAPVQLGAPTSRLESRYSAQMGAISTRTDEMRGLSKDLDDPSVLKQYQMKVDQISRLENAAALTKTTLSSQHRLGMDPKGVLGSAQAAVERIGGRVQSHEFSERAGRGEFGSLKQESASLANMFGDLQRAQEAYIKSSTEGVEAQEAASEKLKDVTSAITEQEGRVRAVGTSGGGGGAGRFSQYANIVGNALGAGISTFSNLGISQPMQIMENQRKFADMHNRQYESAEAAAGGDIMSMMRLGMMDARRRERSETIFGRQQGVVGGNITKDVIFGSAKIAAGMATGGIAGLAMGSSAAGDVGSVISGFADFNKGISAGATSAEMAERYENLFMSMQKIPAGQMQAYESFQRGSYGATTGFGGRSSGMINKMFDKDFMGEAAAMNVSPQEMLELATLGGQTIGGGDFQARSMMTAGRAEKAGILSKGQYMNLLGSMTDVGGRDQNMASILKKSVAEGMDDSKSITRMVSATASLAESGAMQGMNVGEGIAAMMSRGFGALGGKGMTQSQRTGIATSSAMAISEAYGKGGTDIFGLQEYAGMAGIFTGASWEQNKALQEAKEPVVNMMRTLLNTDKGTETYNTAMQNLENSGFGVLMTDKEGNLKKKQIRAFLQQKVSTIVDRQLGYGSTLGPEGKQKVKDALQSGDFSGLSPQEKSIAQLQFNAGNFGQLSSFGAETRIDLTGEKVGADFGGGGIRGSIMDKMAQQGVFQAGKIQAGGDKMFDLFSENFVLQGAGADASKEQKKFFREQQMMETTKGQTKMLSGITDFAGTDLDKEAVQQNQAPGSILKKSAGDFSEGVNTFGKAVSKFNNLMKEMEGGANNRGGSEKSNKTVTNSDTALSAGTAGMFMITD